MRIPLNYGNQRLLKELQQESGLISHPAQINTSLAWLQNGLPQNMKTIGRKALSSLPNPLSGIWIWSR
jgi:hypothetical protein